MKTLGRLMVLARAVKINPLFHEATVTKWFRPLTYTLSTHHGQTKYSYSTIQVCTNPGVDRMINSPREAVDIPHTSTRNFFLGLMEQHGNREAFCDVPTNRRYTYAEVKDKVIRIGSGLTKLGYRKGDVISICALNSVDYIILCMGILSIGGTVLPLSPMSTSDEVKGYLLDSGAAGLATFPEFVPLVEQIRQFLPKLKDIIVIGEAPGCRPIASLLEDDGKAFPEVVDICPETDLALLPYSSGTTGLPKGVMLTHSNVIANIQQFGGAFPTDYDDRMLCYLPFFHIYGLMTTFNAITSGLKLFITPRFEPNFVDVLQEYKISILNLVPPVCLFMTRHPAIKQYDLSSVRVATSGAAALGSQLLQEFKSITGIDHVMQGYGMTECPIAILDNEPARIGSVGRLLPHTSAKVVDMTTGCVVGTGEEGEICLQGPQVMLGYRGNPEATADTIIDGWIHTGDIGHCDEDGYFFVYDRVKELIKYKGYQVAPAELEALLLSHPAIKDVAVIGVPDEEAGELPRAFIVPASEQSANETDIVNYIKERVSSHKRLRGGVKFVESIPKSPSGKILRRMLRTSQ